MGHNFSTSVCNLSKRGGGGGGVLLDVQDESGILDSPLGYDLNMSCVSRMSHYLQLFIITNSLLGVVVSGSMQS
jgi:hypothetical protein